MSWSIFMLAICVLCAGCSSSDQESNTIMEIQNLIGQWQRTTKEQCARIYPGKIEFLSTGIYLTLSEDEGGQALIWQSGDFEFRSSDTVAIQTANDAMRTYSIELTNKELVFIDSNGCKISYQRL